MYFLTEKKKRKKKSIFNVGSLHEGFAVQYFHDLLISFYNIHVYESQLSTTVIWETHRVCSKKLLEDKKNEVHIL